jgi:hypothetical protein
MLAGKLLKYCFKSMGVFAPVNTLNFVKFYYSPVPLANEKRKVKNEK